MKKLLSIITLMTFVILLPSCSFTNNDIQGVSVNEDGDVTVTFRTEGKSVEDVIGSKLSDKKTFYVSSLTSNKSDFYVDWFYVESGGIISRRDGVYRYCPTAETSSITGTVSPPMSVLILSSLSESEIFKPEDADILAEKYGITLNY